MSQQQRPVQTLLTICDLCCNPISEEQSLKRASLAHGYGGTPERSKATAWYLLWDPRSWPGRSGPTFDQQQADKERWKHRHYDFHTECLLRLVEREIAATEPSA